MASPTATPDVGRICRHSLSPSIKQRVHRSGSIDKSTNHISRTENKSSRCGFRASEYFLSSVSISSQDTFPKHCRYRSPDNRRNDDEPQLLECNAADK